ncbi:MAG: DMT family transporter [Bilifractor sp.]
MTSKTDIALKSTEEAVKSTEEATKSAETAKKKFWTRLPVVIVMALISCFLWGSAFPCIKIGYRLFNIASGDSASQILFAGIRFTLAGLMVILIGSLQQKNLLHPKKEMIAPIVGLSFLQTSGQYFFFYIGLAHASGVSSSIIEGANVFFTILVAAWIFRTERLTVNKVLGCVAGFAGVMLIQLPSGGQASIGFHLLGEGFVLISTILAAFSSSFIKKCAQRENPVTISGYQFLVGGIVLMAGGYIAGGRLQVHPSGILLLLYMAFISAAAYTIWSMLLAVNPVSRISVYGFFNPVIGVLLSAALLGESNQAFSIRGILALLLVCLGIILVNRSAERKKIRDTDRGKKEVVS